METTHPSEQSQTTPLGIHPSNVTKHNNLSITPKHIYAKTPKEKLLRT